MPFLTIGPHTVDVTDFAERPPEIIGSIGERAWAGNFLGDARAEKRNWAGRLIVMSGTDYNAIRATVAMGAIVACGGDALFGVTYDCQVQLGEVPYGEDYGNGRALYFEVPVVLRED